ncbi:MAG: translation initiation factor IF-2 [Candidatus Marsarchaeota archaeon]|nr:translation initiation factor IF-2 [Candidatus Marsarchaeota archaeon]MCL5111484.1 translation initiation factor IF-2 [Candidatus Marsarchaeota archaeon]
MIRQPIIVVMGHVDHGKTALLDRIRSSTVAAREAGGITQHIGASEVPIEVIEKICGPMLKNMGNITIPGLLFIDTPGHEAFTNLRRRGGSVADLAILVVDIAQGFQPQTIEAIEILKEYKTPFIVAANKIDLITGWIDSKSKSFGEAIQKQNQRVQNALEQSISQIIGKVSELGFNAERYDRVRNFQKELAIVPISAKTGEGISELLMVVTGLAQRYLEMRLNIEVKGPGKGSILEKKEAKGLGTTIDVILYDGSLRVNDTIAFATPGGIATTKIRALLKAKPLQEIREGSSRFDYVEKVSAAAGIKISGVGLEEAMVGSPVMQATDDRYLSEINAELGDVFQTDRNGIVLKTDSIGSLEAISRLMESMGFRISKKGLGNVTRRDVVDAFSQLSVNPTYEVVLSFNVAIDPEAQAVSFDSGVKVISSNIIYKLIDDYKLLVDEMRRSSLSKAESRLVFPGRVEVLPNSCFRVSHPAIFGVSITLGRIRVGWLLMNDLGEVVGKIKGIQTERSPLESAKSGDVVAISMDEPTFGRQVREGHVLYTRVTDEDEQLLKGEFSNMISADEADLLKQISEIKKSARS